jgi:hypothetical protein
VSHSQPTIIVLSFEAITLFACHKSSSVAFSSFIPSSEVITLAQVKTAMS